MKPTIATQRAALSELFKGIKLASSKSTAAAVSAAPLGGSSSNNSSNTDKWQGFAKFTETLSETSPPAIPLTREESKLAGMLNKYLQNELEKNSSKSPVTDHFLDLFTGLNIISTTQDGPYSKNGTVRPSLHGLNDKQKIAFINTCTEEAPLKQALDELYYHGRLSRAVASAILKNRAYRDVDHMYQLVFGRGNLLGWTVGSCYTFRLQVANKYWVIGEYDKAKMQVVESFSTSWAPVIEGGLISNGVLQGLAKAVLLFKRPDLLMDMVRGRKTQSPNTSNMTAGVDDVARNNVLRRLMPVWVECHKQQAYDICDQVVDTGVYLSKLQADEFYEMIFYCLDALRDGSIGRNTTANDAEFHKLLINHTDGALLVKLADMACESKSRKLYVLLKGYLDGLIGSTSGTRRTVHSETLSTALALQKLQSFEQQQSQHSQPQQGGNSKENTLMAGANTVSSSNSTTAPSSVGAAASSPVNVW